MIMIKPVQIQINQCLNLLEKLFEENLFGVYLYGSAVVGGLQKYSDLDIFA
jgi:predicted nucleotidyltransferase